jgi:hypothetical protein
VRGRWVADATPQIVSPKGGSSLELQLIEALILLLLVVDCAYRLLIPADRADEMSAGPEVLADEVALALPRNTNTMDRSLALDEVDHRRHHILKINM